MSAARTSLAKLLSRAAVRALARPANFRYGEAIYKRGGVEFIRYETALVEGWVGGLAGSVAGGGSQRRRTRLFVQGKDLRWYCAGNPKNHQIFCKHCVALALAILREEVRRRRRNLR